MLELSRPVVLAVLCLERYTSRSKIGSCSV